MSNEQLSKNQRRDAARERARVARQQEQKRTKRNSILIRLGVVVGVLAVAALVVGIIFANRTESVGSPENMASDGIKLTQDGAVTTPAREPGTAPVANDLGPDDDGVVDVVAYVDYQCPICNQFFTTFGENIDQYIADGTITFEVHPIAILDSQSSGTRYSSRAAGAAACVAQYSPDDFMAFDEALYANQPAEGGTGLDDDVIAELASGVVTQNEDEIVECITDRTFQQWALQATNTAAQNPDLLNPTYNSLATPTLFINGEMLDNPGDFLTQITAALTAEGAAVEDTEGDGTEG